MPSHVDGFRQGDTLLPLRLNAGRSSQRTAECETVKDEKRSRRSEAI